MIMGNRKFKFSEMIPNAWFYKLKEMGGRNYNHSHHSHQLSKKKNPSHPPLQPPIKTDSLYSIPAKPHKDSVSQLRKSYYFTREWNPKPTPKSPDITSDFVDPPRKSSKNRRPTTTTSMKSSTSTTIKCSSSSLGDETCIVIDVNTKYLDLKKNDSVSQFQLPPIRTGRKKFNNPVKVISGIHEAIDEPTKLKNRSSKSRETGAYESFPVKVPREESMASSVFKEQGIRPVRRFPTGSPRVKIRINSPRIAKRVQINSTRRSLSTSSRRSISSNSMAVVKSSDDPRKDFRDSMVEMIVENNIWTSKDLEELLAFYIFLNSNEHHDVIIQVFRQIWFDLDNIRVRKVIE